MKLFIKICGITNFEDAKLAISVGADALGFMMYEKSPRMINKKEVSKIIRKLPKEITKVMVFVNSSSSYVRSCLEVSPSLIPQFHGDESPEFCCSFKRPFIKAIRVSGKEDLEKISKDFSKSWMLLLDSYNEDSFGGSGKVFNWNYLQKKVLSTPFLLAGGLTSSNIEKALSLVSCKGLDVSSGVESSPRKKDPKKLKRFIDTARRFGG